MLTLSSWKKNLSESFEVDVKTMFSENASMKDIAAKYPIITGERLTEYYDEYLIENDREVVEEYDADDLGGDDDDCDCTPGDHNCQCPQDYYEFIPSVDGEEYDLEYEWDEVSDDGIEQWKSIKDKMFAEGLLLGDIEVITETKQASVVFKRAKGAIVKKKKCTPGFKLKGRKCIKQTGSDRSANRRLGIKLKRAKKAQGVGKKKRAALKAKITKRKTKGRARTFGDL